MKPSKLLLFIPAFILITGCPGFKGKGKARFLIPDYNSPDIVAMIPPDNLTNDVRAEDTIRRVVAEALVTLGYLIVESPAQEESLREMGLTDGGQLAAFSLTDIANKLGVNGLILPTIETFSEINIGFYQNRKVKLEVKMTDAKGKDLWEAESKANNRAYNLTPQAAAQAFGKKLLGSVVEKMLNVHMLPEATMAAFQIAMKIPGWHKTVPSKLKRIKKEAAKYQKKMEKRSRKR